MKNLEALHTCSCLFCEVTTGSTLNVHHGSETRQVLKLARTYLALGKCESQTGEACDDVIHQGGWKLLHCATSIINIGSNACSRSRLMR